MHRIKRYVNTSILKLIYSALILPHLNYSLLCWGFSINRLQKIQKKAIRVICMSKYNAHTDPLFKYLNLLNVFDLFKLNSLKFAYKYYRGPLPDYFSGMFNSVELNHNYNTRHRNQRYPHPNRSTTKNCVRYFVPMLMNDTPDCITEKIFTHSIQGFTMYVKKYFIDKYNVACQIENCYICRNGVD